MVRREIAPTSQALQVAFSRLFREPMLSESTSFGSRWGIYEMSSSKRYVDTAPTGPELFVRPYTLRRVVPREEEFPFFGKGLSFRVARDVETKLWTLFYLQVRKRTVIG